MFETTREKVARLFTPTTLERIERAGLMIVDKQDFEVVTDGYNTLANVNRDLRIRVIQLERSASGGQAHDT